MKQETKQYIYLAPLSSPSSHFSQRTFTRQHKLNRLRSQLEEMKKERGETSNQDTHELAVVLEKSPDEKLLLEASTEDEIEHLLGDDLDTDDPEDKLSPIVDRIDESMRDREDIEKEISELKVRQALSGSTFTCDNLQKRIEDLVKLLELKESKECYKEGGEELKLAMEESGQEQSSGSAMEELKSSTQVADCKIPDELAQFLSDEILAMDDATLYGSSKAICDGDDHQLLPLVERIKEAIKDPKDIEKQIRELQDCQSLSKMARDYFQKGIDVLEKQSGSKEADGDGDDGQLLPIVERIKEAIKDPEDIKKQIRELKDRQSLSKMTRENFQKGIDVLEKLSGSYEATGSGEEEGEDSVNRKLMIEELVKEQAAFMKGLHTQRKPVMEETVADKGTKAEVVNQKMEDEDKSTVSATKEKEPRDIQMADTIEGDDVQHFD